MAILNKEGYIERIKNIIGEGHDDEALAFLEDMTDTYNSLESAVNDTEDWHGKYDALDAEWRERYKERFFNPPESAIQDDGISEDGEIEAPKTFDELFVEEKGDK